MTADYFETPSGTPDFKTELASKLAEIAPEVVADGKVDFEKVKELLGEDLGDERERFGLFWPGKQRALRAAQAPTSATLKPDFENSKDWETTKNVFIEGDNLEVLKILQKHYHGKIKMIYIDPPYNTGKDFIYPDNYKEGLDTYLEWTRQVNEEGKKISTNSESEGRYHSNWLNMMYPRLKLARNLLSQDGVIMVSIDDNEAPQLRRLMDEIFGSTNFLGQFVWVTKNAARGVPPKTMLMSNHEYVIAYGRNSENVKFAGIERDESDFGNPDNDPRGLWRSESIKATGAQNNYFNIADPLTGNEYYANWAFSEARIQEMIQEGLLLFPSSKAGTPRQKKFIDSYLNDNKAFVTNLGWFSTENATKALMNLFDNKKVFDFPKPVELLEFLVQQTCHDGIVLDFFSGSAATAEAVMSANLRDGGHRSHIQVQLPEPTARESEAFSLGLETIADVGRNRIQRAGERLLKQTESQLLPEQNIADMGYRAFKLCDSNFAKWGVSSAIADNELEAHLFALKDTANEQATEEGLLFELLLKQGHSLSERIDSMSIEGLAIKSIAGNIILAYLNEQVKPSLSQLQEVVALEPARIIVLEDSFQGDDELKTNLVQLCKSKNIELWTA
jgi:adenine-specific DNA-methyltransferase